MKDIESNLRRLQMYNSFTHELSSFFKMTTVKVYAT